MHREENTGPPDCAGAVPDRTSPRDGHLNAEYGPNRRKLLRTALAAGLALTAHGSADAALEPKDPKKMRPQPGDHFVYSSGDEEGQEIKPEGLYTDHAPVLVWAMEPNTKIVRDGSLLNQVLLVRHDPAKLDDETKPHAADGIVAYSAICTHQQCPVMSWIEETRILLCPCHQSEFDPRQNGKVVGGPAPHPLAALPVKIDGGALVAAGTFLGRVGARPG
jgi:rieske iron-sulfur protein